MRKTLQIKGVYPLIPTPFNEDEEFDAGAKKVVRQLIDCAVDKGARGIIVCGGTSEWYALSEAERKEITDIAVGQADGRVQVFVGAMAETTKGAIMYSRYAEAAGADGVMIDPPSYSRPLEHEVYRFFGDIAEAVQNIQIMVYNQPFATGVDISPELLARLGLDFEAITCVKEASLDVGRIGRIRDLCGGELTVIWGSPVCLFDALLLGVRACTGPLATLPLRARLVDAVDQGDLAQAREIWAKLRPVNVQEELERETRPTNYVRAPKAALEFLGFRMGPPRRPVLPATAEEKERIRKHLVSMGVLQE